MQKQTMNNHPFMALKHIQQTNIKFRDHESKRPIGVAPVLFVVFVGIVLHQNGLILVSGRPGIEHPPRVILSIHLPIG